MDVFFGDFSQGERNQLFADSSHLIEFAFQHGEDEKACKKDDVKALRLRKQSKQRAPSSEGGTGVAVQFSENCLKQDVSKSTPSPEIIFQSPSAYTEKAGNGRPSDSVVPKEQHSLGEDAGQHQGETGDGSSSVLNVGAPEFVPVATQPKVDGNVEMRSPSPAEGQPIRYRYVGGNNKQPAYHVHSFPDYHMAPGGFPSHLPLPYPYMLPREPLLQFGFSMGYPYPPPPMAHIPQPRMFPDLALMGQHRPIASHAYPSEMHPVTDLGVQPLSPSSMQPSQENEHPVPQTQSPTEAMESGTQLGGSPDHDRELVLDESSTILSPLHPANIPSGSSNDEVDAPPSVVAEEICNSSASVPETHRDSPTPQADSDVHTDMLSHASTATTQDNSSQSLLIVPSITSDAAESSNDKTKFGDSEILSADGGSPIDVIKDKLPIKDNSTGQVVDTGYINKDTANKDIAANIAANSSLEKIKQLSSSTDSEESLQSGSAQEQLKSSSVDTTASSDEGASAAAGQEEHTQRQGGGWCDESSSSVGAQPNAAQERSAEAEERTADAAPLVDNSNNISSNSSGGDGGSHDNGSKSTNNNTGDRNLPANKSPVLAVMDSKTKPAENHLAYGGGKTDRKPGSNRGKPFASNIGANGSSGRQEQPTARVSSAKSSTKSGASIFLRGPDKKLPPHFAQTVDASPQIAPSTVVAATTTSSNGSNTAIISTAVSSSPAAVTGPNNSSDAGSNHLGSSQSGTTSPSSCQEEPVKKVAWGQSKNWSRLFHSSSPAAEGTGVAGESDKKLSPSSAHGDGASGDDKTLLSRQQPGDTEHVNRQLKALGEQLEKIPIDHQPSRPFVPRGLINRGNMCYVHTALQVMLSCPSWYNLFNSLNQFPMLSKQPSATPLIDCMIRFTHEFSGNELGSETGTGQKPGYKKRGRELVTGTPFQPDYVYNVLHKMAASLTLKGKQEDAEEFLGIILDKLHQEMVEAKKAVGMTEENSISTEDAAGTTSEVAVGNSTDEWEEVGHKNKSAITRMVSSFTESHITEIFGGTMRSAVHQQGVKESATVQPFFALPLDIQANDVCSLEDALTKLSAKESLHGFTCSKTHTEVEAFKRVTLSKLPAVLILHLKRFLFDQTGGSQKITKEISYPMELEIPKELLSPSVLKGKNKGYKLNGVIYHHGKYSAGGHYTCDVYQPLCGGWTRLDDSSIKPVYIDQVLKHHKDRVAYLLFYQKSDIASSNR